MTTQIHGLSVPRLTRRRQDFLSGLRHPAQASHPRPLPDHRPRAKPARKPPSSSPTVCSTATLRLTSPSTKPWPCTSSSTPLNTTGLHAKETDRHFRTHWLPALGRKALKEITTADILKVTDRLARTPIERNHAHAAIRGLLRWATRRRYIAHSPVEGLQLPAKRATEDAGTSPPQNSLSPSSGLRGGFIRATNQSPHAHWATVRPI